MFAYVNISSLAIYAILAVAWYLDQTPWWLLPVLFLYTNQWHLMVKVPFMQAPKQLDKPFNWHDYKGPPTTPGNDNNLGVS